MNQRTKSIGRFIGAGRVLRPRARSSPLSTRCRAKPPRDVHRAMATAGAADRKRQLRLAFGPRARHDEVDQREQPVEKRFEVGRRLRDTRATSAIVAVERAQRELVVRVRQKAHVERPVGIERHAELEAERDDRRVACARAPLPTNVAAMRSLSIACVKLVVSQRKSARSRNAASEARSAAIASISVVAVP